MRRQLLLASAIALPVGVTPAIAQENAPESAKQGGSMIVTYKDDVSTLDPAIGYDWQNWSMIKSLFDGLMDYAPGHDRAGSRSRRELRAVRRRPHLHLQAARRDHLPQRPRADRRRRQMVDRARRAARDPEPRPGLLRHDRGLRRGRRGRRPGAVRHRGDRSAHRPLHAVAARRDLPPRPGAQFLVRRAPGGGRGAWPGLRQQSGRHRRLPHDRLDARPARRVRAQSRLLPRGPAQARPDHLRGRPGAPGGLAAAAARRGRHAGRRHSAGQVPRGHGRSGMERRRGRRRPAPHRLRHDERQRPAVRQQAGAPGGQSRHQQGARRPHHQRPRRAGQPAAAAGHAGLCRGLRGLRLRSRRRPRRCSPRRASPTASTPSCSR